MLAQQSERRSRPPLFCNHLLSSRTAALECAGSIHGACVHVSIAVIRHGRRPDADAELLAHGWHTSTGKDTDMDTDTDACTKALLQHYEHRAHLQAPRVSVLSPVSETRSRAKWHPICFSLFLCAPLHRNVDASSVAALNSVIRFPPHFLWRRHRYLPSYISIPRKGVWRHVATPL